MVDRRARGGLIAPPASRDAPRSYKHPPAEAPADHSTTQRGSASHLVPCRSHSSGRDTHAAATSSTTRETHLSAACRRRSRMVRRTGPSLPMRLSAYVRARGGRGRPAAVKPSRVDATHRAFRERIARRAIRAVEEIDSPSRRRTRRRGDALAGNVARDVSHAHCRAARSARCWRGRRKTHCWREPSRAMRRTGWLETHRRRRDRLRRRGAGSHCGPPVRS